MMEDENEEVTMILAAETARTRRYEDLRRRPRVTGEDKATQTDVKDQSFKESHHKIDISSKLLSYMAFSLVIGTLCQFKFFSTMTTDYFRYFAIFVSLTLTLVLQSIVAYILLRASISRHEPSNSKVALNLNFYLTVLIASVTFINMVVFILV